MRNLPKSEPDRQAGQLGIRHRLDEDGEVSACDPKGLRHLIAEVGASQIVMGTDYPYPWTKTAVDHILGTPGLSDAERAAILGETAEKLLAIKPA